MVTCPHTDSVKFILYHYCLWTLIFDLLNLGLISFKIIHQLVSENLTNHQLLDLLKMLLCIIKQWKFVVQNKLKM